MKLAQKWLEKFGGLENEEEGVNYQIAPFKVSSKCCYYLKEKPCSDWAKEHNCVPYLGLMASEGGRRAVTTLEKVPFVRLHLQFLIDRIYYSWHLI